VSEYLKRPDWVRRFNMLGPALGSDAELVRLEADELIGIACRITGLDDFGDLPWQPAYRQLVRSLDAEAALHTLGRTMCRAEIIRMLRMRLLLTEHWKHNPEILESEVQPPVIITGSPRSGTTILQELLSLDPQFHVLYAWKCLYPLPLLSDPEADRAERLRLSQCELEFWPDIQPEFMSMHELASELPIECSAIEKMEFSASYWNFVADCPSWTQWRMAEGRYLACYRWNRRVMQTPQHGQPTKSWLMKSPGHLENLRTIFSMYPQARVIQTHRDPLKTLPSTTSICATARWIRSDRVDIQSMASEFAVGYPLLLDSVAADRTSGRLPDAQFVDSHFLDLMNDPVGCIRRIYEQLGRPFTDTFAADILRYLQNKPKDKFGKHRYRVEDMGVDVAELRARCRNYMQHFGVRSEH
jgi:hypothetical protein